MLGICKTSPTEQCVFCQGQGIYVGENYEVCPYCAGKGERSMKFILRVLEFPWIFEFRVAMRVLWETFVDDFLNKGKK